MALQSITALATITLQEPSGSVEFSGIPNTYRDLILVMNFTTTGSSSQTLYFNGDTTGGNYTGIYMRGTGSSANSGATGQYISTTPGSRLLFKVELLDYSATDKHTTYISQADNASNQVVARAMRWSNTAAVNAISIVNDSNSFASGSTFALFGRIA